MEGRCQKIVFSLKPFEHRSKGPRQFGGSIRSISKRRKGTSLDIVDLDVLASNAAGSLVLRVTILVELEAAVAIVVGAKGIGLVDLGVIGEFTVCLAVLGISK